MPCWLFSFNVGFLGFARLFILLSEMFFSASEIDSSRWFSSFSFPTFRAPHSGCSNKPLPNWTGSRKNLSLTFWVLLLFQQKRSARQRAQCSTLRFCHTTCRPSFLVVLFGFEPLPCSVRPRSQHPNPSCLLVFCGIPSSHRHQIPTGCASTRSPNIRSSPSGG